MLKEKRQGAEDRIIWTKYGQLDDDLWLDFDVASKGVERFMVGDEFNRLSPTPEPEKDVRWVVDPENSEFHNQPLRFDPNGITPCLYITKGLFYSAERSNPAITGSVVRVGGGKPDLDLHSVTTTIGADIIIDEPEGKALLQWSRDADPFLILSNREAGVHYEIFVNNSPALTGQMPERDFSRYYQSVLGLPPTQRFELQYPLGGAANAPCSPIFPVGD